MEVTQKRAGNERMESKPETRKVPSGPSWRVLGAEQKRDNCHQGAE